MSLGVSRACRAIPDRTLRDELERVQAEHADRIFLHFGGRSHTFAEFVDATLRAGTAWKALGIEPGDLAAVSLPNSDRFLTAWLGLNTVGGALVPVNTYFKSSEANTFRAPSEARVLLTTAELYEQQVAAIRGELPRLERVVLLDNELDGPSFAELQ